VDASGFLAKAGGVTSALKYAQVAETVRDMVSDGTLKPGQPAPSGAQLSRLTGFHVITCRKALQSLVREGVLARGGPPGGRPAEALSRALAARRRACGLTQPDLAAMTGFSVTAIGHAETGRLWQSRAFWEKADVALAAGGELTRLHDAYRAGTTAPAPCEAAGAPPARPVPAALVVSRITLHWSDGSTTSYQPPTPAS
jgi:hypothetical protein